MTVFVFDNFYNGDPVPNGIPVDDNHQFFHKFKNRLDEYHENVCRIPLLNEINMIDSNIKFMTLNQALERNTPFIYLIDILYSLSYWLELPSNLKKNYRLWDNIDSRIFNYLKSGQGYLLLGFFKNFQMDPYHYGLKNKLSDLIDYFDIPINRFSIWTAQSGLDEMLIEKKIEVVNFNYFEYKWYEYFRNYQDENQVVSFDQFKKSQNTIKEKSFLCFNRKPYEHRILNYQYFIESNLINDSLFSFPGRNEGLIFENRNDIKMHINSELLRKFKNFIPPDQNLVVDVPNLNTMHISACSPTPYLQTYISVVTERTFYGDSRLQSHLAKTFKTITNFHPFIVLARAGYLKSLRELGYQTFEECWDESYDEIENHNERMIAVWDLLKNLSNLSKKELHELIRKTDRIVEYNYQHYFNRIKLYNLENEYHKLLSKL